MRRRFPRLAGCVVQGLVMGLLLWLALFGLLTAGGGARLFRYQGF